MPTVEVTFTPLPAHVRTARLVALAVARRAGVAEELLDEVRFAVGEACSRAVGVHAGKAPGTPVTMVLSDDVNEFAVEVTDVGVLSDGEPDAETLDPEVLSEPASAGDREPGTDALPSGFGLAVISGLVEDVDVQSSSDGTRVRMVWPSADPFTADLG